MNKRYIINDRIKAKDVRLIDSTGKQIGIVPLEQARRLAEDSNLDLLLLSPDTEPPVCKIVDFGQFKYEQAKKEKAARKSSKSHVLKELKMSPKISDHDYQVRLTKGKEFLQKSYSVKVSIFFKGREASRPELGFAVLNRFLEDIKVTGAVPSEISKGPRSLHVHISPKGH